MVEDLYKDVRARVRKQEVPIIELMLEYSFLDYLEWEKSFRDELFRQNSLDKGDGILLL